MEIKRVNLENIRSYEKAEVEFPKGSVLLSGDIGSGKSSVLLAVEFALFGLQKGSLSGSSLLRNGAETGRVKVNLNVDGKDIVIERNLKRKKSVAQESGSITIDGAKEDISTEEMRSRVLKMLNYPAEFLKKNPELYRYTVYTPQEEMKQILIENVDTRLNTLRRVFAIDKYKRISENATLFLTRLRENIRNKEGMISDIDTKKENLGEKNKEADIVNNNLMCILPELKKASDDVIHKKEKISAIESDIKILNQLKTNFASIESEIKAKNEMSEKIRDDIKDANDEIKRLTARLGIIKAEDIAKIAKENAENMARKEQELKDSEKTMNEADKETALLEKKRAELMDLKNNISKLDVCPTCSQRIIPQYKSVVLTEIEGKLRKILDDISKCSGKKMENEKKVSGLEKEIDVLNKRQEELNDFKIIGINLEEKQKSAKKLRDGDKKIFDGNRTNMHKRDELRQKIKSMETVEKDYLKARQDLDCARDEEKKIEIKKAETNKQLQAFNNAINELKAEIKKKEDIKAAIAGCIKIRSWIEEQFLSILSIIEKNVMLKLHHEFNMFFEKWFNMLVAGEGLRARLDENFTPIIEQAGYDIDYSFLSGGERTAAALAYRLSLNQVINSMLSHIKTRDLLILDEPTDGFSAEQLDKMKYVLQEINAKQLILVSHEFKIENFVDNIIRFEKEGHISRIG